MNRATESRLAALERQSGREVDEIVFVTQYEDRAGAIADVLVSSASEAAARATLDRLPRPGRICVWTKPGRPS